MACIADCAYVVHTYGQRVEHHGEGCQPAECRLVLRPAAGKMSCCGTDACVVLSLAFGQQFQNPRNLTQHTSSNFWDGWMVRRGFDAPELLDEGEEALHAACRKCFAKKPLACTKKHPKEKLST